MIQLRPDQQALKQGVYQHWASGAPNVAAVLPTGGGKCLGRDTPVLMFDGTIKMSQDVMVGDRLMGPDSTARDVISTVSGMDDLFRVTPVKGDPYVVNSKHILSLRRTNEAANPRYPCEMRGGEIENIPVMEYLAASKWFKHVRKGWRAPVDFAGCKALDIEPYFLGLWLGDGHSRTPSITTMDADVTDYITDYAARLNMRVRIQQKPNNRAHMIHIVQSDPKARKSTPLTRFLRSENLLLNKHIPLKYKTGSREDRLLLLAGLLDSDGHLSGGSFEITFKVERLMDDLIYLARSLGFSAYKTKCRKTCTNNGVTDTYFRCNINGDLDRIPTRVKRQQAAPRRQKKNVLNVGISVEPVGPGEFFGWQVRGADHLFMLGDFTVTHNSVLVSDIILDGHNSRMNEVIMAHRNELVGQMSMHVARRGIQHRIIGSKSTVAGVVQEHRAEFGRSFVNPDAACSVGSVQTIVSRKAELKAWAAQIHRWTLDECHHALDANIWGDAIRMFTNACGLGVTACTLRADGKGIGRHADGVFDAMVQGPTMRELIEMGSLSDFEIVVPETDFQIDENAVTDKGDFSPNRMREASRKSHIVGDVVEQYARWALGKRAIVFATDVETATDMANRFNAAGVSAAAVSAKTDTGVRRDMIRRFRDGRLSVLVNVDLFDEGFDVPACEVVILARPTQSLNKYLQMVGRALRTFLGKLVGLVIDMVSNYKRHGLPDKLVPQTLDRREKRASRAADPDDIPLTACRSCSRPYKRVHTVCPYCGEAPPVPEGGGRTIEQVDGDLILLDRNTLAQMRAATELESPADMAQRVARAAGDLAGRGAANRQIERIGAQQRLTAAVEQWAGVRRAMGDSDRMIHKRFYLTTGSDVLSAMAGSRQEMENMAGIIEGWYSNA